MQKAKGGAAIWRKAVRMAGKERSVSKKAEIFPVCGLVILKFIMAHFPELEDI